MKAFYVLLLGLLIVCNSFAQTVEQVLNDYRKEAGIALEKLNATLEKEGTSIAARLVSQGDTKGAEEVSRQVTDTIEGRGLSSPHKALAILVTQYNAAKQTALKPRRDTAIKKLDVLLKSSAGKDMQNVVQIAKARDEIESGVPLRSDSTSAMLLNSKIPKEWTYHADPSGKVLDGFVTINDNGTFELRGRPGSAGATPGTWTATTDPMTITIKLGNGEVGKIVFDGKEAVLERAIGTRYLKVKK